METYTLQRFYHEAKAIIEKYHIQGKDDYEFTVQFQIKEESPNKNPKLKCYINYCHKEYNSLYPRFLGFSHTPHGALEEFEENILKQTDSSILDRVAANIPEDNTESA